MMCFVDEADHVDIAMLTYNLIEYSDNYSDTSGESDDKWPDVLGTVEFLNRPGTKLYLPVDMASAWSLTISPTVRSISVLTGCNSSDDNPNLTIDNSQSFKYKAALVGKTTNQNNGNSFLKDTKIVKVFV